jgi:hypothetical protein
VGKIFINYRRGSDAGFTQALYQNLKSEFAVDDLFMDVGGHIQAGEKFVEVLNSQVAACDVFLAVIGPRWTELLAARQDDPDDFVVIEIKAALDQDKYVIPVRVDNASMPPADKLPEKIRPLVGRNAFPLRPESFEADCQGFIAALKVILEAAEKARIAAEKERAARISENGLITVFKESLEATEEGRAVRTVLILGSFAAERKVVLDALREELRKLNYVPILFDFEVPAGRNITETVTLLARMARFIIAELTDPRSIPQELQAIIPSVRVPVQPLLLEGSSLYSMFEGYWDFHWVLPVYQYKDTKQLLATLADVIAPAEEKAKALEGRWRKDRIDQA